MSIKLRRTIFYGLVILFILSGFIIVMYSRGWRINIGNCENSNPETGFGNQIKNFLTCEIAFQKTGAIYLEVKPRGDAAIKINGKPFEDKSGLLQAGTLITELLPKSFRVEIARDDYFSWVKNMKVKPELVTDAQDIVLIPKQFEKEILSFSSVRGNEIIAIDPSSGKILSKNSKDGFFYLYDPGATSTAININSSFRNLVSTDAASDVAFHPFDKNKMIVSGKNGLYVLDLLRLNTDIISNTKSAAWTTKGSGVYYFVKNPASKQIKNSGYSLFYFNLIIKNQSFVTTTDSAITTPLKIDVSNSQSLIAILDDSGGLYLFNQSNQSLKKISSKATDFAFSPDNKKIAFADTDGKLNIFFLEDWPVDNPKKAGDSVQFELSAAPNAIAWYKDNYHLLFFYPDGIKFAEIDDRSPWNIYGIAAEANAGNSYYDAGSNFIYWLQGKNFYRIKIQ